MLETSHTFKLQLCKQMNVSLLCFDFRAAIIVSYLTQLPTRALIVLHELVIRLLEALRHFGLLCGLLSIG